MVSIGEVAERSKAQTWKVCVPETVPRVRISPSPHFFEKDFGIQISAKKMIAPAIKLMITETSTAPAATSLASLISSL